MVNVAPGSPASELTAWPGCARDRTLDDRLRSKYDRRSTQKHAPILQDVGRGGEPEREPNILFHEEHGQAFSSIQVVDDAEEVLDRSRRQPHRRLD